eukprot:1749182-Rhodomonas_salina.1
MQSISTLPGPDIRCALPCPYNGCAASRYCTKLLQRPDMNSETEEVLLTGQGLEELCSFSKFKCLEALWLNDNKLRKVEGLDTNVQVSSAARLPAYNAMRGSHGACDGCRSRRCTSTTTS